MFLSIAWICLLGASIAHAQVTIKAQIDGLHPMQTIEGFGASDAWACQFAGTWPDAKRNQIADLLFSTENNANGQPLGIGLNIWRFSIGAGSAEQGATSDIGDEWRRQASFLNLNGQYNWDAMPGQLWFLTAAKKRGVKQFLAFVNSPHVLFTLNGKAYSSDGKSNLDSAKTDLFSQDIVQTLKRIFNKTGIQFNYISPVNEPQWKWNEHNQEGCPYTNSQIVNVVNSLSKALLASKLSAKIQIAEAGQLDYLYSDKDKQKGLQVKDFFDSSSPNYIGNLSNVDKSISGHSYFTTSPEKRSVEIRTAVANEVGKIAGLRYWMSEYCILGDDIMKGEKRDLGISPGLFVAKLIHHDLTISNAVTWQWWLAVSPNDYKDGLVYIDKNKANGNVYDSKMLWAMGNYSRFIPPGSQRLPVNVSAIDLPVYISSYRYKKQLITVVVNMHTSPVVIDLSYNQGSLGKISTYVTSAASNLSPGKKYTRASQIEISAQSITTILCN